MQNQIRTIQQQTATLAGKNSYIRKSTKEFMEKWAQVSEGGEEIYSKSEIYVEEKGQYFSLVAGRKDILGAEGMEMDNNEYFWNFLKMSDLREFIKLFPMMNYIFASGMI